MLLAASPPVLSWARRRAGAWRDERLGGAASLGFSRAGVVAGASVAGVPPAPPSARDRAAARIRSNSAASLIAARSACSWDLRLRISRRISSASAGSEP